MMKKPKHPGTILNNLYLKPLEITSAELAHRLGVSPATISNITSGRSGVSMMMAHKLAKAFDTTPEFWLNLQRNYNIATKHKQIKNEVKSVRVFKRVKKARLSQAA